ncbi:hypothetical protein TWF694_004713 [Orbilia ellipsospora]|uniref:Peptidase A1 domain-containing protein n=1 Tax=Orbilia ellipsospora TaxID=2528407 RepID=A0AAV9WYI5_9PEZI
MHFSKLVPTITIITCYAGVFAIPTASTPKVVSLPYVKHHKWGHIHPEQLKKRGHVNDPIINNDYDQPYNYLTKFSVGTPPQLMEFSIDTGSSEIYMFDPATCASIDCTGGVGFNKAKSTTFHDLNQHVEFDYGDGSIGVSGGYFKDNVLIGGVTISQYQMALMNHSIGGLDTQIMGLSGNVGSQTYRVLPQYMADQGITQSAAYAVYMGDVRTPGGNLTFGGYDSSKVSGKMYTTPWHPTNNGGANPVITALWINDTTPGFVGRTSLTSITYPYQANLDCGEQFTIFPSDIYDQVMTHFGFCQQSNFVWCDSLTRQGEFQFQIQGSGGITINVPFSQFYLPVLNPDGTPSTQIRNGVPAAVCFFGVQRGDDINAGYFNLGDPFLRGAVVIYDADRNQAAFGQAAYNVSESKSNIVEINKSGNLLGQATLSTIPWATPTKSYAPTCF